MRGLCLLMLVVCGSVLGAAEPCVSGVPVGKRPGPYSFLVATGPEKGQQTCYICEQEDKPTVVMFTRSLGEANGKLLQQLDGLATKHSEDGLKIWMTQLCKKADLEALSAWSKTLGLKSVPVGAFEDEDGPPSYLLSSDADCTVLVFVKKKVVANHVYRAGELTDTALAEVLKSVPPILVKE